MVQHYEEFLTCYCLYYLCFQYPIFNFGTAPWFCLCYGSFLSMRGVGDRIFLDYGTVIITSDLRDCDLSNFSGGVFLSSSGSWIIRSNRMPSWMEISPFTGLTRWITSLQTWYRLLPPTQSYKPQRDCLWNFMLPSNFLGGKKELHFFIMQLVFKSIINPIFYRSFSF